MTSPASAGRQSNISSKELLPKLVAFAAGMVGKPVKDRDPVVGFALTGHIGKPVWVAQAINPRRVFCLRLRDLSVGVFLFMKKNLSWWVLGLLAIFFSFVMVVVGGVIGDTLRILVALLWIFAVIDLIRVLVQKAKKKHE